MQGKMEEKRKLNIKVTYEHELLNPFYAANDLEIAEDEPVSTDTLKSWVIMKDDMFKDPASAEKEAEPDGCGGAQEDPLKAADESISASFFLIYDIYLHTGRFLLSDLTGMYHYALRQYLYIERQRLSDLSIYICADIFS